MNEYIPEFTSIFKEEFKNFVLYKRGNGSHFQKMVINKEISASHARVLSKLESDEQIEELAKRIVKENLNVRDIEHIVNNKDVIKRKPMSTSSSLVSEPKYHIYENVISDKIGNKVKINKNKIEITFDSIKDLERIMEIFNIIIEDE